jgi:hypothetical protein
MDLNILALVLSVAALLASTYLAVRQGELMRRANFVPAYMQLLNEFRSLEFNRNYEYVVTRLHEHDPALGISGLPEDARRALYDVAYFYQGFGALRLIRVVDDQILAALHLRIMRVWAAVEPFVVRERELNGATGVYLMRILEDFATDAAKIPFESVDRMLTRRRLR